MCTGNVSGGDVRRQAVFDLGDQVFEAQFSLFQPLQRQLVCRVPFGQRGDCFVQIAVFAAKTSNSTRRISSFFMDRSEGAFISSSIPSLCQNTNIGVRDVPA